MFIRWQSTQQQISQSSQDGTPDVGWTVILAESYDVDGDPRQRLVAYIASITESSIKIDSQRCHFWDRVARALDRLGNQVSDDDRAQIEVEIALKVPRPSLAEYKDIARDSARRLGWDFLTEAQQAALQREAEDLQHAEALDESTGASDGKTSVASDGQASGIENVLCSFCGKSQEDAFALVSSGQAHICDECIETAAALVTARKANEAAPT
jgi:hypothetical protein